MQCQKVEVLKLESSCMTKYLIIAIIVFVVLSLYFLLVRYSAEHSEVIINTSGVYKSTRFEDGNFEFDRIIPHLLGSKTQRKPKKFNSRLLIKSFDFNFDKTQENIYNFGNNQGDSLYVKWLMFRSYLLFDKFPNTIVLNKETSLIKNYLAIGSCISDETAISVDYKNNSFCYVDVVKDPFFLNVDNTQNNQHILLENIHVENGYELLDYYENTVLLAEYEKDRGKMTSDEYRLSVPKSFLYFIEKDKSHFEELPLNKENAQMIPSAIGIGFIIYYDNSKKDNFSYQVLDLKTSKFSEKINIMAINISNNKKDFFFNKENNSFITFKETSIGNNKEVLTFNLFNSKIKSIPISNLK